MRKVPLVLLGAVAGIALTVATAQTRFFLTDPGAKSIDSASRYQLLGVFGEAFERVRAFYVEKPDDRKLVAKAVNGMLSELEDSYYLEVEPRTRADTCTGPDCALALGNVGVGYTTQHGLVTVTSPFEETPAAKSGIMARDVIIGLDDDPLQGLTYYEVAERLRGKVGSTIKLNVLRPGRDKPMEFSIVRERIKTRSVRGRGDGGDIGYIRITQFNETTQDQLKKAIDDINGQIAPEKLKGFVVDLRNNPGGFLEAAVGVADAFLQQGEIVSISGRKAGASRHFNAKPGDLANGKPVIVLINAGSAAAAEVVAGALQDGHRATIIGTRSFGEGAAVTAIPLGPGKGVIHLATGHYVTPAGHDIEAKGIAPDVEVLQDLPDDLKPSANAIGKEQVALQSYIPPDATADKALNAAYATLRGVKDSGR